MKRRKVIILGICAVLLLAGCENSTAQSSESTETAAASTHAVKSTVTLTEGKYSEEKLNSAWDEKSAVSVQCSGESISADGDGITAEGGTATVSRAGTYILTGELTDGQLIVDTEDTDSVRLIFNGISLASASTAPIYVKNGDVIITLAENTENTVSDAAEYTYAEVEDEPKAAIYAKDDLTFNGTGTLTVSGNFNNAIQCKNDVKFITGTYNITAVNNGIVGKDSVSVKNGNFTIEAGGDGIKSTNIEETDKGYVLLEEGSFSIQAEGDGIQAETLLRVNAGTFDITTGGGSPENVGQEQTMDGGMGGGMGGKSPGDQNPGGGTMQAPDGEMPQSGEAGENAEAPQMPQEKPDGQGQDGQLQEGQQPGEPPADRPDQQQDTGDAEETVSTKGLKSYVDLIIAGGTFELDTYDDGVHSNQNVTVDGGTMTVQTGDDGIHAEQKLAINGGSVDVQKSYEGLEGFEIEINDGDIKVVASDDGINAAGDDDSAENPEDSETQSTNTDTSEPEEKQKDSSLAKADTMAAKDETQTQERGQMGGMKGGQMADEDQGSVLTINGGNVYVNASGDGLDANGNIYITGGTVTVQGPVNGGNGTLDYASECKITGGVFLGAGSVGMVQNPSDSSAQTVIVRTLDKAAEAGATVKVTDSKGDTVAEFTAEKAAQWFCISASDIKEEEEYTVSVGEDEAQITVEGVVVEI